MKAWRFIKSIRTVRRSIVGAAIISSIPLAICVDIFIQHAGAPTEYIAETAHAEEIEEVEKPVVIEEVIVWDKARIDREIEEQAAKYGTSAATLKRIVKCESGYVTDIQSNHVLKYGREQSFGLAQIHLPSHPDISYEQAIDPEFAIAYLAKHYAQGTDKWSCK